jgi:hypothetical protein
MGSTRDLERSDRDVAQPTHTDLREGQTGLEPSVDLDTGIDDPGTAGKPMRPDPKPIGSIGHSVGDLSRGFVHSKSGHLAVHSRISPLASSARSPL